MMLFMLCGEPLSSSTLTDDEVASGEMGRKIIEEDGGSRRQVLKDEVKPAP